MIVLQPRWTKIRGKSTEKKTEKIRKKSKKISKKVLNKILRHYLHYHHNHPTRPLFFFLIFFADNCLFVDSPPLPHSCSPMSSSSSSSSISCHLVLPCQHNDFHLLVLWSKQSKLTMLVDPKRCQDFIIRGRDKPADLKRPNWTKLTQQRLLRQSLSGTQACLRTTISGVMDSLYLVRMVRKKSRNPKLKFLNFSPKNPEDFAQKFCRPEQKSPFSISSYVELNIS